MCKFTVNTEQLFYLITATHNSVNIHFISITDDMLKTQATENTEGQQTGHQS